MSTPYEEVPPPPDEPPYSEDIWPSPDQPYDVADRLLEEWAQQGLATYRSWREGRYVWADGVWREAEDTELRDRIATRLLRASYMGPKDRPTPWRPTPRRVAEIIDALDTRSRVDRDIELGTWLHAPTGRPAIALTNGLLDINTRRFIAHTPNWWSTTLIPTAYSPTAPRPERWHAFLDELWSEDEESKRLLQEWFGYVLSGRTDMHKIMLMIGPPRSGKGTIARTLDSLVGRANIAAPTLSALAQNFGLEPLLGKSLAIVGDARLKRDVDIVTERLLSISGEDAITVDRKNRTAVTGRLPTRIMILSNEFPRFADAAGAITSRFVTLVFAKSFAGREDHLLGDTLQGELSGILLWALEGLDRLNGGRLTNPASSDAVVRDMADAASPISAFLRDCCIQDDGEEVDSKVFAENYRTWRSEVGYEHEISNVTVGHQLMAAVPGLTKRRGPRGPSGTRGWLYHGVSVRPREAWGDPESDPVVQVEDSWSNSGPSRSGQLGPHPDLQGWGGGPSGPSTFTKTVRS